MIDQTCKNCSTVSGGNFCPACGQTMDVHLMSVGEFVHETIDVLFDLEARAWRSVRPLLLHPGKLTREYFAGRRAAYLSPFRIYFVLSVVYFLLGNLLSFVPSAAVDILSGGIDVDAQAQVQVEPREPVTVPVGGGREVTIESVEDCAAFADAYSAIVGTFAARVCHGVMIDGWQSLVLKYRDNVPIMSFILIPIIAALMWPLFALSRRKYVEHLIFLLHTHAFLFAFLSLSLLASWMAGLLPVLEWPVRLLTIAGWIYVSAYFFTAMYKGYGQGVALTTVKLLLVGGIHIVCFVAIFTAGLLLTAATL